MSRDVVDIFLVRHCESVGNVEKKLQGWFDSPLTEQGKLQAEELARMLSGRGIRHVYSSPLHRAMDTARAIAAGSGCRVEELELLKEIDVGSGEGLTIDEVESRFPDELTRLRDRTLSDASLPGGETLNHFHERAGQLWAFLTDGTVYDKMACVSHGWMLNALLKIVRDEPLSARNMVFPNGGVQHLKKRAGRWEVVSLDFVEKETHAMRVWQIFR